MWAGVLLGRANGGMWDSQAHLLLSSGFPFDAVLWGGGLEDQRDASFITIISPSPSARKNLFIICSTNGTHQFLGAGCSTETTGFVRFGLGREIWEPACPPPNYSLGLKKIPGTW